MINLGRTQKYDSIWFLLSLTYKQKGGNFIEHFISDYKGMQKHTKTEMKKQIEQEHNTSKV